MKKLTILCAPDSFKESMSAQRACEAMEKGIHKYNQKIEVIKCPMADGGEGTVDALVSATNGQNHKTFVNDPLGNRIEAKYGLLGDLKTAVIEMAEASGLEKVPVEKRNPLLTSSFGTGQLILACLDHKVEKILIGIGGSATNDGGSGMLEALGVRFLDKNNQSLHMNGNTLKEIESIDISQLDKRLKDIHIDVACDVDNTLCGDKGASAVYGPQKGASGEMVKILDSNLMHYASIIKKDLGIDVLNLKGGGAAGGLGVALSAFLNGNLKRGISLVIDYAKLEDKMKSVDLVFTGEGKMDEQTQYGKTPMGVALVAKKYQKPLIGFCGKKGDKADILLDLGFKALIQISDDRLPLEIVLKEGSNNLEKAVYSYLENEKPV